MFKFRKNNEIELTAPIEGVAIDLKEVPDPVFSTKMMGDGIAIIPAHNTIYAPFKAEILHIFPTYHALGLRTEEGIEVLLHIGIDTVNLKGEGFTKHIDGGEWVEKGQPLLSFDRDFIQSKQISDLILMIITNSHEMKSISPQFGEVNLETTVLTVHK